MYKHNQKAFTLFEVLISLFITSVIYLVSFPSFIQLYDYLKLNQTLATFEADVNHIRQYNMMPGNPSPSMIIQINHQKNYYELIERGLIIKLRRHFPKGITSPNSNALSTIKFNSSGNISQGGSFEIQSQSFKKKVVFSIGSGGMDFQ